MYTKEELQRGLRTRLVGKKLFLFDSIDSTNSCAKTLGDAGCEEGIVVFADFQTSGRGRQGRSWIAERGSNLLFSILLRPPLPRESAGLLAFFASVAVARALETTAGCQIECKWPNDLLLNGKKLCGILLENTFQEQTLAYSVIGVGLNVNQAAFPPELAGRATSLAAELRIDFDRKQLFQRILEETDTLYAEIRREGFKRVLSDWLAHCRMFGQTVTVQQEDRRVSGRAVCLNDDGGLVVETAAGQQIVYAGDVTVLGESWFASRSS